MTIRGRASAPAVFGGLALLVAGPLLGSGLVLAVDLAQAPRPGLASSYWGLPEGTHEGTPARLPLDALFAGLGVIDAVAVGQKLLLLAIVFLAGLGMYRAVQVENAAAATFAGLLYSVNPFVYDRLYTGQWFLLLGYALLPHAFLQFRRTLEGRPLAPWGYGGLFLLTGIASTHMALLLLLMCVVTMGCWLAREGWDRRLLARALLALALGLLPSLYWLLPTPGVQDFLDQIGPGQLALYRTVADDRWGLGLTVAGLSGYWNNDEPIRSFLPAWPLFTATFVALAAWGALLRRRAPDAVAVAVFGLLGFLVALGDAAALTREPFTWALANVPPLRAFREPQKALALLVFAYAYLGAVAIEDLLRLPRARSVRAVAGIAVALLPLMWGYRTFWGLWDRLETTHFPSSWEQADAYLERHAASSRTLFLPWNGYFRPSFAYGRVVANPAPAFFQTPILASRSVGDGADISDNSDPDETRVRGVLAAARRGGPFASCLTPLGVGYVLSARNPESHEYAFLRRRKDLRLVRRWSDLELYRADSRAALLMSASGPQRRCSARLRPLAFRRISPVQYRLDRTPASGALALGLPQRADWRREGASVSYDRWPAYRRNYALGALGLAVLLGSGLIAVRGRRARADPSD